MTLEQLSLEINPTPAMLAGTQTVWQCAWCGTVVVLPSTAYVKKPRSTCPAGHDEDHGWWKQDLPVAGLRRATVTVDHADLGVALQRLGRDDFTPGERAAAGRVLDVWEAGR